MADQDMCEDGASDFASLSGGAILPGDVIYIPAAAIVMEKATKNHNCGIRAMCSFLNSRSRKVLDLYQQVHSSCLALAFASC